MFLFVVKIKYSKGPGLGTSIANFKDDKDAKIFIKGKLVEDAKVKLSNFYQLCEGLEVVDEFGQDSIEPGIYGIGGASGSLSSSSGSGSGSEQKSRFQPTPFNASPRPPGSPPNWLKDADDEDDKEK